MMNETDFYGTRTSTIDCQACVIRSGCSSRLTLSHGDLASNAETDNCETRPEPSVIRVQLSPLSQKVFASLPRPSAEINMYSRNHVHRCVLGSVHMEQAELPEVHTVGFDKLREGAKLMTHYYASLPPATNKVLEVFMQTKSDLCLRVLSMTISLISISICFTLFKSQWKQFNTQPQHFFHGTHGRFLHIIDEPVGDDMEAITAFLYLLKDDFSALSEVVKEVIARRKVATCPTSSTPTEQTLL